ncbi:MAG: sterol desaturase family protein [Verrucomicrobiota bacterium]
MNQTSGVVASLAVGFTGYAIWTFLEYLLHRYLLHGPRSAAKRGHTRHHREPLTPLGSPVLSVAATMFVVWFLAWCLIPLDLACYFALGLTFGYFHFAFFHDVIHHWKYSERFFPTLFYSHEVHHKKPKVNYGTTTLFWDWVFGTLDLSRPKSVAQTAESES